MIEDKTKPTRPTPQARSDKGSFRSLDEDTIEVICRHRVQHRHMHGVRHGHDEPSIANHSQRRG